MILRGRRVVTGGALTAAAIHIENGVITAVRPFEEAGAPVIDEVILPGLVDTHVHINEPGRTHWEGFETATRAAAAGGVTTLIEMPLNSIPATTTVAAYRRKLEAAEGKLSVDTGFWGGVVPGNTKDLEGLWREGVFGFKCFLAPSGVDEFERHLFGHELGALVMPGHFFQRDRLLFIADAAVGNADAAHGAGVDHAVYPGLARRFLCMPSCRHF